MESLASAFSGIVFLLQIVITKTRFATARSGFLLLIFAVALIFGLAADFSYQQYQLWKSDSISQYFLPPHQDFSYFIFYARTRFFNPYLFSLVLGLAFLAAAKIFNKKFGERFFEPIEPYLLATAIFLTGHPAWIIYLIALLISAIIFSSVISYWSPMKERRLSFYYLWLPAAIFTILISKWLSALPWWQTLKI